MCGIAGFIDLSRSLADLDLQNMVRIMGNAIDHRGPDHQGLWADRAQGIALVHQRLSIIDGSHQGHQPMCSPDQRYVMSFNGEIYNFQSLRQELIQKGACFRGHSDTEVLIACFSYWGIDKTIKKINGMFAIALFDRQLNLLYLIRDRLGQKPLYYARQGHYFFFASELKALRRHPFFQANINHDALASYIRLNYVPAPLSIYQETFKLLPAHFLVVSLDHGDLSEPMCYWNHQLIAESAQHTLFSGSSKEAEEQLETLLKEAVRLRRVSDVPLGAFLSGGIDSSLVVSLMQAQSTQPIKTFTIGFKEAAYNEAHAARAVAMHLGTEHTEHYILAQQACDIIPKLPSVYDEPFSDVSQIPTYLLSQLTRQHVIVALSGDGGDEWFAGYHRHIWLPVLWRYFRCLPSILRPMCSKMITYLLSTVSNRWVGSYQKDRMMRVASLLRHQNPADMYTDLISSWYDPTSGLLQGNEERLSEIRDFFKQSHLDLTHRMMFLDAHHYLPDDILVKVDRASMAMGLEVRAPLLDYRIVEFAWHLPLAYKVAGQSGKKILKNILKKYLPATLIDRPKQGFGVPIGDWLKGPLQSWANDLLDPVFLKKQGYFNPQLIEKKWLAHQSGQSNEQYCLWNLLMFQCWLENTF